MHLKLEKPPKTDSPQCAVPSQSISMITRIFLTVHFDTFRLGRKNDNEWLLKTYQVGEKVNHIISQYISWGINRGELAGTTDYFETIMHMWGMISGVIKLASEKEDYIRIRGDKSKEEFLQIGFKKIYKAIAKEPSQ